MMLRQAHQENDVLMNTRKRKVPVKVILAAVVAVLVLASLTIFVIVQYRIRIELTQFLSILRGLTQTQESIDGKIGQVAEDVSAAADKRKVLTPAEKEAIANEVRNFHDEIDSARERLDSFEQEARQGLAKHNQDVVLDRIADVRTYLDSVQLAQELLQGAVTVTFAEPKPRPPEGPKERLLRGALKRAYAEAGKALQELAESGAWPKPEFRENERGLKRAFDAVKEVLEKLDNENP
jgi:hypothetical protein